MNRLPKKFEEEVLSKHGIEWVNYFNEYRKAYMEDVANIYGYDVSPYEIAGIALEELNTTCNATFSINKNKLDYQTVKEYIKEQIDRDNYNDCNLDDIDNNKNLYALHIFPRTPVISYLIWSQDYFECIFEAVNEIWKDE